MGILGPRTINIPAGFSKKTPTIIVWDNIDFGQETQTGHGTMHHTNGLMVQRVVNALTDGSERVSLKKGERSLKIS